MPRLPSPSTIRTFVNACMKASSLGVQSARSFAAIAVWAASTSAWPWRSAASSSSSQMASICPSMYA